MPSDDTASAGNSSSNANGSSGPLGLVVKTPSADEREQLGLGANEGVLVSRISGEAAKRAGLRVGDVILRVGRTAVASAKEFTDAVKDVKVGDTAMLLVRRGEQTQFVAVTPRKGD